MQVYLVNTEDDKEGDYQYYFADSFNDLDEKLEDVSINVIKKAGEAVLWNNYKDTVDWLYLYKYNYTRPDHESPVGITGMVIAAGDDELFKFFRKFGIIDVNWVQCLGDVY